MGHNVGIYGNRWDFLRYTRDQRVVRFARKDGFVRVCTNWYFVLR